MTYIRTCPACLRTFDRPVDLDRHWPDCAKREAYHAEQKRLFEEHKIAMYVPDDRRPNR